MGFLSRAIHTLHCSCVQVSIGASEKNFIRGYNISFRPLPKGRGKGTKQIGSVCGYNQNSLWSLCCTRLHFH